MGQWTFPTGSLQSCHSRTQSAGQDLLLSPQLSFWNNMLLPKQITALSTADFGQIASQSFWLTERFYKCADLWYYYCSLESPTKYAVTSIKYQTKQISHSCMCETNIIYIIQTGFSILGLFTPAINMRPGWLDHKRTAQSTGVNALKQSRVSVTQTTFQLSLTLSSHSCSSNLLALWRWRDQGTCLSSGLCRWKWFTCLSACRAGKLDTVSSVHVRRMWRHTLMAGVNRQI